MSEPIAPRKRWPLSERSALTAPSAARVVTVGGKVPQLGSSSSATSSSAGGAKPLGKPLGRLALARGAGRPIHRREREDDLAQRLLGRERSCAFLGRGLGQGPQAIQAPQAVSPAGAATGASSAPISVCAFESLPRISVSDAMTPRIAIPAPTMKASA